MPEQSGANCALTALFYERAFTAMANVGREEFTKHNDKVIYIWTDLRERERKKKTGQQVAQDILLLIVIFHKVNR